MALIHAIFYLRFLDLCTSMYVVLPQPTRADIQERGKSIINIRRSNLLPASSDGSHNLAAANFN